MANNNPTPRAAGDAWTADEIKKLKKLYPKSDNQVIAEQLDVTVGAVRAKAVQLKLKKADHYWDKSEEQYILKNWGVLSAQEIADKLKRTKWSVYAKYRELQQK